MSVNRLLANLAQSLDSSSVGSFLSGDSADRFQTLQWTDVSGRPTVADSAITTSIIDSAYIQSRVTTYAVGLDSATTISLLDSDYIRSKVTNDVGFFIYHYDTTAGQTLLDSSNEASNNAISYTKDYVMVFKNGVLLADSADYTATSGDTIVLTSGADSGEVVTVVKWSPGDPPVVRDFYGDLGVVLGAWPSGHVQYYNITTPGNATSAGSVGNEQWSAVSDATYGVGGGGYSATTTMYYITFASLGNAATFGTLNTGKRYSGGASDGTTGLFAGGSISSTEIDSITIATQGNSSSFGSLITVSELNGGISNKVIAVFGPGDRTDERLQSINFSTGGRAIFGYDNASGINIRNSSTSCSDLTRGLIAGGPNFLGTNSITYITTATPSNSTDFGDLTQGRSRIASTTNDTYAVFNGGYQSSGTPSTSFNIIEYVTIQTTGNATDFGDLVESKDHLAATSGNGA